jgi:hypothetical protein
VCPQGMSHPRARHLTALTTNTAAHAPVARAVLAIILSFFQIIENGEGRRPRRPRRRGWCRAIPGDTMPRAVLAIISDFLTWAESEWHFFMNLSAEGSILDFLISNTGWLIDSATATSSVSHIQLRDPLRPGRHGLLA